MRKKDIIRLLRHADNTEQISKDYPGLTDAEREMLFSRITQKLQAAQTEEAAPAEEEQFTIVQESRFSRVFPAAAAAVCMLALCGTFAGLFWMKGQMQSPVQPDPTESLNFEINHEFAIGDKYAANNFTQSGTLWMTVTETAYDGDLFRVDLLLENERAVSIADNAIGAPYLFMADNFMAATGQNGDNWLTIQPCKITMSNVQEGLPNTVSLRSGESCELSLWFKTESLPAEWKLVTSYSVANSYTVITMKED